MLNHRNLPNDYKHIVHHIRIWFENVIEDFLLEGTANVWSQFFMVKTKLSYRHFLKFGEFFENLCKIMKDMKVKEEIY